MTVVYSLATTHVAPTTATATITGSVSGSVTGLAPGRVFTELNDSLAPAIVFLPTGTTSDGYPGAMLPFTTNVGTVT